MAKQIHLTLAHSPDPDDVFMWWPITGMIDPASVGHERATVISKPEIDTGSFVFHASAQDIAVLNRRAISPGDLDITAMSMFTYAHVQSSYILTDCGSSVGDNYGPKVVTKINQRDLPMNKACFAVPGIQTTAFSCLCMWMDWSKESDWQGRVVEMPFDRILEAVAEGQSNGHRIDAGVLIHQSQLTYDRLGLEERIDFGRFWKERTGLPLPLGANAIRRDLDDAYGSGTAARIAHILRTSVDYALAHRKRSLEYARRFAPEISQVQAERYIDMYVSPYTVSLGEIGRQSVERLISEASGRGLCPDFDQAREHIIR